MRLAGGMANEKDLQGLPEHLREDISAPTVPDPADEAGDRDVNLPEEQTLGGPEFNARHYTGGQLNAGTETAGLSTDGKYAKNREDELES